MTVPSFDFSKLTPLDVRAALSATGCFRVSHPRLPPARCASVLDDARTFFALPLDAKLALGIDRSAHFRGYSEMRNERDFREQIHFGVEAPAAGNGPAFLGLEGPNLWPADSGWRTRIETYLADVAAVAEDVLSSIARSLELPPDSFQELVRDPYLLMKLKTSGAPSACDPKSVEALGSTRLD